jgi:hypothetical protein
MSPNQMKSLSNCASERDVSKCFHAAYFSAKNAQEKRTVPEKQEKAHVCAILILRHTGPLLLAYRGAQTQHKKIT